MSSINHRNGQIAQLKIQIKAIEKGLTVSTPNLPQCRYDIILDDKKNIIRGQIKFCNSKTSKNTLLICLDKGKHHGKMYSDKEIDIILVYVPILDKILMYPPKMFNNKRHISINLSNPKSKYFFGKFVW